MRFLRCKRQHVAQGRHAFRYDPVVDPARPTFPRQEPRLVQDSQVMTHGRLRESERLHEVADASFTGRLCRDEAQKAEAGRIRDGLEDARQLFSIHLAQTALKHWSTAPCAGDPNRHLSILTDFEIACKRRQRMMLESADLISPLPALRVSTRERLPQRVSARFARVRCAVAH